MAKYNWAIIRDDYEIHGMSYSQLQNKYGASRGLISGRAKKDGWNKQKTEQAISNAVNAHKALAEITEQNRTEFKERSVLVDKEVEDRLRREGVHLNALEYCTALASKIIREKVKDGTAELHDTNIFSQVVNRNKDGIMGKMPQTQVNIQNNVGSDADAIIDALMVKHN